jgi:Domain of unknown function (DUF3474)
MSIDHAGGRQWKPVNISVSPHGDGDLPTFIPPPFTIKELLAAIPAHCFERSFLHSSAYLVLDLAMVLTLGYLATFIDFTFAGVSGWLAWSAYWFAQGIVCTGIWVIAHECKPRSYIRCTSHRTDVLPRWASGLRNFQHNQQRCWMGAPLSSPRSSL